MTQEKRKPPPVLTKERFEALLKQAITPKEKQPVPPID